MSASASFTGASLSVRSVTPISASRIRLTFTQTPVRINSSGTTDSLNPNNYILTGPASATVSSVDAVLADSLSVDLNTNTPLLYGSWTVTVSNVQTGGGANLAPPYSGSFTVAQQQTGLTAGAESEDAYTVIRKHFNAALDGPNWQALIHALATADEYVWTLAQRAFDQIFLSTAGGKYLRRIASDSGIQEYPGLGLSDDQFRELAIKLSTGRVTYISILEILESYYGPEALRAYADTQSGPFALAAGQTLVFNFEGREYTYEVLSPEFQLVNTATAQELAVSLTNFFGKKGLDAKASVKVDPSTGLSFVRVFSGALGLRSNLKIVGGTAQPFVGFDTYKNVYSGTVASGDSYGWVYDLTSTGKTRLTYTWSTAFLKPKIDIESVVAGDYLVIGTDTATQGWYTVESATYEWTGANLYKQTIVLTENIGFTGTIVQQSNSSYRFYTPTAHLVSNGSRTVVVSQSSPNVLDVQVPATASVNRNAGDAAYIVGNDAADILSIERKNGTVTVQTSGNHGLTAGRQVDIRGFRPGLGRGWVVPSDATNSGGAFTHAMATLQSTFITVNTNASIGVRSTGEVLVAGGFNGAASTGSLSVKTTPATIGGATQASGAKDTSYVPENYATSFPMSTARYDSGSSMLSGPMADQFLVSGGFTDANAGTPTDSTEKLAGTLGKQWFATANMISARALHQQVTLNDGNVLVSGGMPTVYQSTKSCEIYQPLLDAWIPTGSMNVARHGHKLHKLPDGKVLAIGGFSAGQQTNNTSPGIVEQWRFDTVSGTTPGLNGHDLTTAATITAEGKIDGCLTMAGGGSDPATYAANSTLHDAFAMTNGVGMSLDFWVYGMGNGNVALVSYDKTGRTTSADNAIFQLNEGAPNHLVFSWESGTLTSSGSIDGDFSAVGVTAPWITFTDLWRHVAITGTVVNTSNVIFKMYVDGVLIATSAELPAPSGGSASHLSVGKDNVLGNANYVGSFDDMRLWDRPLSDGEVQQQFLQGAGFSTGKNINDIQPYTSVVRSLESVEIYDPSLGTWSLTNGMSSCRGFFESVELDNGDILVLGGLGHRVGQYPTMTGAFGDDLMFVWPNHRLQDTEIYSPSTGTWRPGPMMPSPKSSLWAVKVGDRVYCNDAAPDFDLINGVWTWAATAPSDIHFLNLNTFKWGSLAPWNLQNPPVSPNYRTWAAASNGIAILGGFKTDLIPFFDAIVGDSTGGSANEINGQHKLLTASGNQFTFATDEQGYTSNLALNELHLPLSENFAFQNPRTASRTSNVTTVTVAVPEGTLAVFINSVHGFFSSGVKVLTNWTATTISYAEVAANVGSTASAVYVSTPLVVPQSEMVSGAGTDGIYVISPTRWTALSGESTLTTGLDKGTAYSILTVPSTSTFPDGNGYVVLNLGYSNESKPLKYLEVISPTELLMQGFTSTETYTAGTPVTLISLSSTNDIDNAFWVTGALAAQLAAHKDVTDSVANDVDLNWSVVYPSDRGLGGEGSSNSDAPKVWGPDIFDSGF